MAFGKLNGFYSIFCSVMVYNERGSPRVAAGEFVCIFLYFVRFEMYWVNGHFLLLFRCFKFLKYTVQNI